MSFNINSDKVKVKDLENMQSNFKGYLEDKFKKNKNEKVIYFFSLQEDKTESLLFTKDVIEMIIKYQYKYDVISKGIDSFNVKNIILYPEGIDINSDKIIIPHKKSIFNIFSIDTYTKCSIIRKITSDNLNLYFIASHLPINMSDVKTFGNEERMKIIIDILSEIFNKDNKEKIIFWAGDLNFRINKENGVDQLTNFIESLKQPSNDIDKLKIQMLSDYNIQLNDNDFGPTCKTTTKYEKKEQCFKDKIYTTKKNNNISECYEQIDKKIPSYCDRVMVITNKNLQYKINKSTVIIDNPFTYYSDHNAINSLIQFDYINESLVGGNYYQKYLKYKNKYIQLKIKHFGKINGGMPGNQVDVVQTENAGIKRESDDENDDVIPESKKPKITNIIINDDDKIQSDIVTPPNQLTNIEQSPIIPPSKPTSIEHDPMTLSSQPTSIEHDPITLPSQPPSIIEPSLLLNIYEFKLQNYQIIPEKYYDNKFNIPQKTPDGACGLINTKYSGKPENISVFDNNNIRSCDNISSSSENEIDPDNIGFYDGIYKNCDPKNEPKNIGKIPGCKINSDIISQLQVLLIVNKQKNIGTFKCNPSTHDNSFIYQLNINNKEKKVIIIGDIHGGFHTFYRLMKRFEYNNYISIVNNEKELNYKVNDGFVLLFCGDILDRGAYTMEILMIICNLIYNSNTDGNIKIIYNRGNHEHNMYNSDNDDRSNKEFISQIENEYTTKFFISHLTNFLNTCPCAVVINYEDIGKKIWVCHGGIPFDDVTFRLNFNNNIMKVDSSRTYKIMWCDFNHILIDGTDQGSNRKNIGNIQLEQFLSNNKIDFIIRGHQDSYGNSFLFLKNHLSHDINKLNRLLTIRNLLLILKKNKNFLAQHFLSILDKKHYTIPNHSDNVDFKLGPIAILNLNNFNNPENIFKKVITISSNTAFGRPLTYDSYVLLE